MPLRLLEIADYDAVHELWLGIDGIARFLARNPKTNFVACEEGRIVGVMLCGHDGRRAYIYHAAVKSSHRGRGIGTALLDVVISALEKEGIRKAALVVFEDNVIGSRFWEKAGFTRRHDLSYRDRALVSQS